MIDPSLILSAATPFGVIHYLAFDKPIGEALTRYGQWASVEIRFISQFIHPGDTVVDGGANVGTHMMAFADACGPDGRVIAIEASPEISSVLARTIADNDLSQVDLQVAALGASVGTARIPALDPSQIQNAGMLQILPDGAGDTHRQAAFDIPLVTLDAMALDSLSLLKLDIEGGEACALRGAAKTIRRHRPVIIVELLTLDAALSVLKLLAPLDYTAWFCSFPAFDAYNFKNDVDNIFGHAREASILFLPDTEMAPVILPDCHVVQFTSIDELARLLFEMPRYGDETDHDRVAEALVADRAELRERLNTMTDAKIDPALDMDDSMETNVPQTLFKRELHHLWHHLSSSISGITQQLEEIAPLSKRIDDKADAATLHKTMDEVARLAALVDRKANNADAIADRAVLNEIGHRLDVLPSRADLDTVHMQAVDAVAALGIPQMVGRLENSEAELFRIDGAITAVKTEVTSLRAAMLGRSEDRARLSLVIERIDSTVNMVRNETRGLETLVREQHRENWTLRDQVLTLKTNLEEQRDDAVTHRELIDSLHERINYLTEDLEARRKRWRRIVGKKGSLRDRFANRLFIRRDR